MSRLLILAASLALTGCSYLGQIAWQALDQAGRYSAKRVAVDDISVPEGFRAVRVVNGLNFPSAFTFGDDGTIYILESHTVPVPQLTPKIVRVRRDGRIDRVDLTGADAPNGETAIGLMFHDGWLYFSHEQKDATFSISRVRPSGGNVEPVLKSIPVTGDHDVNHLVFDKEGNLYFGVGSATNSGVVASGDPVNQKWLKDHPETRDIPCRDIHLTGRTFTDEGGVTGAFQPYKQSNARVVRGEPMCTSSIYRLRRGGTTPELIAWGFRNPVALAFDRDGTLLVGNQGADVRSTRPVPNDPDSVFRVRQDHWYGWPDYTASLQPLDGGVIDVMGSNLSPPDRSLLVAATEPHAAISGMAVMSDGAVLVAEMGDFKPLTDPEKNVRAGFQVERIAGGSIAPYLRNRNEGDAEPASTLDLRNGFERPVDVRIGPDGLIYVLDFGAFVTAGGGEPKAMPKTGKLFVIEKR